MIQKPAKIGAIILAAGEGRRFGMAKALVSWRGQSFLERAMALFSRSDICETVVVLGAERARVMDMHCLEGVSLVCHSDWNQGMLSSLQAGLKNFENSCDYFIIHQVDMPFVKKTTVENLVKASISLRQNLVFPVHGERTGHPYLISGALKKTLLHLPPTASARDALRNEKTRALQVPVSDAGIHVNVNRREDLEMFSNKF
jgi:CTP:molybdopterin cytidylyltransferase MocA